MSSVKTLKYLIETVIRPDYTDDPRLGMTGQTGWINWQTLTSTPLHAFPSWIKNSVYAKKKDYNKTIIEQDSLHESTGTC